MRRAAADPAAPSLRELHELLAELQAAASRLPSDIGEQNITTESRQRADHKDAERLAEWVCQKLPVNAYCVVFDAIDALDRTAIMETLENDIGDIYADLLDGIRQYEAGRHGDALWAWRFSYWSHWGRHLTHAQTAVYSALALGDAI
jgi:Domain of unknown function (DUF5063)